MQCDKQIKMMPTLQMICTVFDAHSPFVRHLSRTKQLTESSLHEMDPLTVNYVWALSHGSEFVASTLAATIKRTSVNATTWFEELSSSSSVPRTPVAQLL